MCHGVRAACVGSVCKFYESPVPWSLAQAHARAHARYTTKLKRLTVGVEGAGLRGGATGDVREVGSVLKDGERVGSDDGSGNRS